MLHGSDELLNTSSSRPVFGHRAGRQCVKAICAVVAAVTRGFADAVDLALFLADMSVVPLIGL